MFKLQSQNPYMHVNNQLVYPFTRQQSTEFFLIEPLSGHFLPANEHQPEQHKVDGNGYQHHENRRKPLARAQPKEKVEPGEGEFAMTIRAPKEITQDDLSKGLFLPCAGSRYDDTKAVKYAGYGGYYTSSILFEDSKDYARSLSFDNDGVYDNNGENCRNGNSIRPVVVE